MLFSPVVSPKEGASSDVSNSPAKCATAEAVKEPMSPAIRRLTQSAAYPRGVEERTHTKRTHTSIPRGASTIGTVGLGIPDNGFGGPGEEPLHLRESIASEPFRERLESIAATMSRVSRSEVHHFSPVPNSSDPSSNSGKTTS